ncbi:hypothetical protein PMAYCL1PPCAC_30564, partial [Pristionchus mayeri]
MVGDHREEYAREERRSQRGLMKLNVLNQSVGSTALLDDLKESAGVGAAANEYIRLPSSDYLRTTTSFAHFARTRSNLSQASPTEVKMGVPLSGIGEVDVEGCNLILDDIVYEVPQSDRKKTEDEQKLESKHHSELGELAQSASLRALLWAESWECNYAA